MRSDRQIKRYRAPHREERHEREQYFFDDCTRIAFADLLATFERPCCLCAPTVGEELHARGRAVRVLDIDERFEMLAGYRRFNIRSPQHMSERFDVVFCDPPFFTVSLSELFAAVRLLHAFDLTRPFLMTYLTRRAAAVEAVFLPFSLRRTSIRPGYLTVQPEPHNDIVLFTNFTLPDWFVARMKDRLSPAAETTS